MARIKSQGTKVYALVAGAIVRFTCYNAIDLGQDSTSKIDVTCLDDDEKSYERGMVDPGEGTLTVQVDDENASHATGLSLAESGEELDWFVGSKGDDAPPTVSGGVVTLPKSRNWLTYKGYLNKASPTIEADGVWTYAWPLVRTSSVNTILRDPTP
ncbi:phage tail tube protein [Acinetobacter soli]|uniref:phage tail tube protein n=1 Tax=Acinetobacter soli TaxID=487316 RepID=UPI0012501DEA|nr:phage tail tube protein [Acinetobacter soli]